MENTIKLIINDLLLYGKEQEYVCAPPPMLLYIVVTTDVTVSGFACFAVLTFICSLHIFVSDARGII